MNILRSLLPTFSIPSREKIIENVCFKGGGVNAFAFIGVHQALDTLGITPQLKRFVGSSAGAIFAAGMAVKIPTAKLVELVESTDFSKFKDAHVGIAGEAYNIYENLGLYKGDYFYEWFSKMLQETIGAADITFAQVYARFGSELVITTTDLTCKKVVYMSRNTTPTMQIRAAVRRSMSIPVFFIPVRETDSQGIEHVYVDGGCTNNFPLDYFDDICDPLATIGFNLEEGTSGCSIDPNSPVDPQPIKNLIDLAVALINTETFEIELLRLKTGDCKRIICIDTFGNRSTNFDIQNADVGKLIENGKTATINGLAR